MEIRKDGMEKWCTESGIFIICPLEHLAEKLKIPEDVITRKLGEVHGIITTNVFSKIRVDKSYGINQNGELISKIELINETNILNDQKHEVVRFLSKHELTEDEYIESQKLRLESKKSKMIDYLNEIVQIKEEYKNLILKT
jgi:hypothetical protein